MCVVLVFIQVISCVLAATMQRMAISGVYIGQYRSSKTSVSIFYMEKMCRLHKLMIIIGIQKMNRKNCCLLTTKEIQIMTMCSIQYRNWFHEYLTVVRIDVPYIIIINRDIFLVNFTNIPQRGVCTVAETPNKGR